MTEANGQLAAPTRAPALAPTPDELQRRALRRILLAALTALRETDEATAGVAEAVVAECQSVRKQVRQ
jgi:hypothetical protein